MGIFCIYNFHLKFGFKLTEFRTRQNFYNLNKLKMRAAQLCTLSFIITVITICNYFELDHTHWVNESLMYLKDTH